jgi:hypothetical protein
VRKHSESKIQEVLPHAQACNIFLCIRSQRVLSVASALRATGRDEEGKIALRRVGELHTNSIELDRKMHKSMVGGAR